ncbi:hypothetical protein FQN52_003742 [Onygenales sp. PD_12]|nr:hypothetical protein FQN52_003742 [Onygenales sp. PD_12]
MASRTPASSTIPALRIPLQQPGTTASSPATPGSALPTQQLQESQSQSQSQQQQQQQPSFPPPQTFDILPPLHDLLLRLASTPPNHPQPQPSQPQPQQQQPPTRSAPIDTTAVAQLDPKLLLSEASAVKIRIQKAKAALEGLPDMRRGVEEQEVEIEELERRIERLRGVVGELGRRGRGVM